MPSEGNLQIKGKPLTLVSKVLAILFVLACSIYYLIARGTITPGESTSIIQIGLFLAAIFSPVDLSLLIRNIKGLPETDTPKKEGDHD
ncbi:MAG: hypothetical protein C4574_00585 [Candidatus Latescibacterota bacterium]|jgi:hypothetical protein|nr:MAG: hypothetical protein C4574_00585 [Candidatus Latescibacterota bacterium]